MSPRAICVAILSLQAAYSMALVPATPALLGRDPVVLEALQGSLAAMAAGGAFARVGEASPALGCSIATAPGRSSSRASCRSRAR
jgi:hypothetical protein